MHRFNGTVMARAIFAALFASCLLANAATTMTIPAALDVPATQTLSLELHATGVQIYECKAGKDDPSRFEWVFKAPEADLFDPAGKKVGKHYAGPTWELDDGSQVVGEVKAKDNGPDAGAIAWLLLTVKSATGTGAFAATQSIQRAYTSGGKAPADGCDPAAAGRQVRVPYRATYLFYVART